MAVPAAAARRADLDKATIHNCVDVEWSFPKHPDALKCGHEAGADKNFFEHEGTMPLHYWSMGLGLVFLADLAITGLIVALVLAIRWVARGYRAEIPRRA